MDPASAADISAVDDGAGSSISTIHSDVIQTHILTRLDGPALASAACASAQLRRLCAEDDLWKNICAATWPSLDDPLVRDVISAFPNGHRSIFYDSFPSLQPLPSTKKHLYRPSPSTELISAVDMYYKDTPIFSKVQRTDTQTGWFLCSTLWVDLLDPKEFVPTPVKYVPKDEEWLKHLEDNLSLSWILIDPTRKRSGNLSSRRPVSVQRHWLTRDLEILYSVTVARDQMSSECLQCTIKVTCGGKAGGEMHVRGVSLMVEDMEGKSMTGRESLGILQRAMESAERTKVTQEEAKGRYEKFLGMKRQRRERKQRIEKATDIISVMIIILVFVFFCSFMLF
ncbi:F-box protein At2g27310-like [Neltuma alba]|uniref:F-box protein At2g27310-like n=1 Tax=Neltuma alba TaxID=207710 RepID=UPI0010A312EB|nr:F-box protein At2g27310-like [Prosopis alba]